MDYESAKDCAEGISEGIARAVREAGDLQAAATLYASGGALSYRQAVEEALDLGERLDIERRRRAALCVQAREAWVRGLERRKAELEARLANPEGLKDTPPGTETNGGGPTFGEILEEELADVCAELYG